MSQGQGQAHGHAGHQNGQLLPPRPTSNGVFPEIVETELSEGSRDLLRNLVVKDIPLANLDEARENEWIWRLRQKRELFFAMHPGHECEVVGEDRAAINGDATATLRPLSPEQKQIVRDFFDVLETRPTRARGMKQQEMMNMDIRENRLDRGEDNQQKDGLLSRFRG